MEQIISAFTDLLKYMDDDDIIRCFSDACINGIDSIVEGLNGIDDLILEEEINKEETQKSYDEFLLEFEEKIKSQIASIGLIDPKLHTDIVSGVRDFNRKFVPQNAIQQSSVGVFTKGNGIVVSVVTRDIEGLFKIHINSNDHTSLLKYTHQLIESGRILVSSSIIPDREAFRLKSYAAYDLIGAVQPICTN